MSTVSLLALILRIAYWLLKKISYAEITAAEKRGEDMGEVKQFFLWKSELDRRAEEAAIVGDDVVSGRVRVDPETDPFNRARRK